MAEREAPSGAVSGLEDDMLGWGRARKIARSGMILCAVRMCCGGLYNVGRVGWLPSQKMLEREKPWAVGTNRSDATSGVLFIELHTGQDCELGIAGLKES